MGNKKKNYKKNLQINILMLKSIGLRSPEQSFLACFSSLVFCVLLLLVKEEWVVFSLLGCSVVVCLPLRPLT